MALQFWKIKRELLRAKQQLSIVGISLLGRTKTRAYDKQRDKHLTVQTCNPRANVNIAIVLIYQPADIPKSLIRIFKQLNQAGFDVLVVSNSDLTENQASSMCPHVWRIIDRPNLGYDFGGYREGVLHILEGNHAFEQLMILNDSVWYLPDTFEQITDHHSSKPNGISGSILRKKRNMSWLESYVYLIPKCVCEMPVFKKYWNNYILTNSKFWVIRKGERDFTHRMAQAGVALNPMMSNALFIESLKTETPDFLKTTLEYAGETKEHLHNERRLLLLDYTDSQQWAERAIEHTITCLESGEFNSQFTYAAINKFNYPFLKKSRDSVNYFWRETFIKAHDAGNIPPIDGHILDEIRAQQTKGADGRPHWLN